jgi:adenylylsulfate kinase
MSDPIPERGCVIWFTGLSGAGKSTIADILRADLVSRGCKVEVLDGDVVRENLSKGLGFSRQDRDINIARIGFVANLLARNGVKVITAAISPYRHTRDQVRDLVGSGFIEVYISTPLEVCEDRDVKGLYAKARSGDIKEFTGVSDPYEPPLNPEIEIPTVGQSPRQAADLIVRWLTERGYLDGVANQAAL